VIGGYLGAGKTTLLNALLRNADGVRYAVLVNDFGSVNVDAELIASTGAQTIELTNGCTCCTIGGDLILALKDLVARDWAPERIVIEASGVADPQSVARQAACHPALSVQARIIVADAESIVERAEDKYVGGLVRRQIAAADTIVLSKVDLVDTGQLARLRGWMAQAAPNAPLIESAWGDEFAAELMLVHHSATDLHAPAPETGRHGHSAFTAMTFYSAEPLDRTRFLNAVEAMLPVVARAKGTLYFADAPQARCLFQLAGERWSLEPFAPSERVPRTRIVTIALAQREGQLEEVLRMLRRAEVRREELDARD